jgi:hypothetical protein
MRRTASLAIGVAQLRQHMRHDLGQWLALEIGGRRL